MVKKKNRKKENKKKEAKAKAKKKEKKNSRKKAKIKKEKAKVKKARKKEKKAKIRSVVTSGMAEESTPVNETGLLEPIEDTSISVNARTAISIIRSLETVTSINNYTEGDERITVKKAASSKITSLLKELQKRI